MNETILIVEDDNKMIELISDGLDSDGYKLIVAKNGKQALAMLRQHQCQLVLLDVMMPVMDGWETLRKLREFSNVPVIMLTGLDSEINQIRGLEIGADDYIIKPISIKIVQARVKTVLRRDKSLTRPTKPILSYNNGALIIDQPKSLVTVRGQKVELAPTEYRLLLFLILNEGKVVTKHEILASVWGPGYEDDSKVLGLYISRLRRKIEINSKNPRYIMTSRGQGYYFESGDNAENHEQIK